MATLANLAMVQNTVSVDSAIPDRPIARLMLLCCVLLGLVSEASGGAMSLTLRPAAHDLHAGQTIMQLAAVISKMFVGAFMLAGGVIGDIYGRRRMLLWGSVVVLVASVGATSTTTD